MPASGGRARDREVAPAPGASRLPPTGARTSSSPGAAPSSSRSFRSACSWTRSTTTWARLNPRELERLGAERPADLAAVFPALADLGPARWVSRRAGARALPHPPGGPGAARGLAATARRWSSPSTTSTGPTRLRSSSSCHLLRTRRAGGPARPRIAAGAGPERACAAAERASGMASATLIELEPLAREEIGALLGEASGAERRDELYRESGGNPFYLEQLTRAGHGAAVGAAATAPDVPGTVAAALKRSWQRLPRGARAPARGAVAGEPFDVDLAAAAAGVDGARLLAALDEALALISCVRPRSLGASASAIRSCAVPCTTPRPGLARGRARPRGRALAERGAPAAARAHHVERWPPSPATPTLSPCSSRRATPPPHARRARPRAGSRRRCAWCRRAIAAGWSSSRRWPRPRARRAAGREPRRAVRAPARAAARAPEVRGAGRGVHRAHRAPDRPPRRGARRDRRRAGRAARPALAGGGGPDDRAGP